MPFIAFLGCDGSGKSAVIAGVSERMREMGTPVAYGHWCPRAFGSPSGPGGATADDPHGAEPRDPLSSILKLGWLWLNWRVAWFRGLGRDSRRGVVLFDRYHADLLVDPRRYRYGGPQFLARWASRLMPRPDLIFFLDAAPEILLARKQEVPKEALESARGRYLALASREPRLCVIDAGAPLDRVVANVLERITELKR